MLKLLDFSGNLIIYNNNCSSLISIIGFFNLIKIIRDHEDLNFRTNGYLDPNDSLVFIKNVKNNNNNNNNEIDQNAYINHL